MIEHIIVGEFTIRVAVKVKPTRFALPNSSVLLSHLESLTKEELLATIYNGSYLDQPTGVTELNVNSPIKDPITMLTGDIPQELKELK